MENMLQPLPVLTKQLKMEKNKIIETEADLMEIIRDQANTIHEQDETIITQTFLIGGLAFAVCVLAISLYFK